MHDGNGDCVWCQDYAASSGSSDLLHANRVFGDLMVSGHVNDVTADSQNVAVSRRRFRTKLPFLHSSIYWMHSILED